MNMTLYRLLERTLYMRLKNSLCRRLFGLRVYRTKEEDSEWETGKDFLLTLEGSISRSLY